MITLESGKIGIVILNYMTYELTIECLKSLTNFSYEDFFVVVVDNYSPNDSFREITDYISRNTLNYDVYLVKSDKNGGYSYGNNLGIKKAEGLKAEYILVMNNDIIIKDNDFLAKIISYFHENENLAMVGPGIIQKEGMIEIPLLPKRVNPFKYIVGNLLYPFSILWNKILRKALQNKKGPIKVYAVSGCCFMMRADVFREIGYFDDSLFLYGEEHILGEKLYQRDYEVYFVPDIRVIHNHSTTIGSVYDHKKMVAMQIDSRNYCLEMYRRDISERLRHMMMYSDCFREKTYMRLIIQFKSCFESR